MQFVHFRVPAGTSLDGRLVADGVSHFARVNGCRLGEPYFANNAEDADTLNVYVDVLGGDDA